MYVDVTKQGPTMMSCIFVLALYCGALIQLTDADNCKRYYKGNRIEGPKVCEFGQSCCGSCENRYCCPFPSLLELVTSHIVSLSEEVQDACPNNFFEYGSEDADFRMFLIVAIAVVGVILISLIIFCCVCPCCCLYQMCRKPRPVVTSNTRTTVVVNNAPPPHAARAQQHHGPPPQQQQQQYHPTYQPVAMQSWSGSSAPAQGYDGHPVPSAPMLPDVYGPPPPYNESAISGNYNQRAFTQGPASYY